MSTETGCIQHGRLATTSTQVVANQNCSHETQFGKRTFSAGDPSVWNSLPPAATLTVIVHSDELEVTYILLCFYCITFSPVCCDYCNAKSAWLTLCDWGLQTLHSAIVQSAWLTLCVQTLHSAIVQFMRIVRLTLQSVHQFDARGAQTLVTSDGQKLTKQLITNSLIN